MKALVYHGANQRAWEEKPQPALQKTTDAIVKISKTTICGTDLHIMKGDLPRVVDGLTLGHEGVGVVVEAGSAVTNFKKGDRVVISCVASCANAPRARRACPRIAPTAAGSSGISSMGPRRNSSGFRMPTGAFIIFPPTSPTRSRW